MQALPVLETPAPIPSPVAPPAARPVALQYLVDVKNLLQAQVALRNKRVYLPSLFGHYSVNSNCNLRCSYCYVGQPEIFPEGFKQRGLPLDRAKRVLRNLRREVIGLRIQGGEPFLYRELPELVRFSKRELRFWHVSIITNGLALEKHPERWTDMLEDVDLITISIDRTRLREYPEQMARLTAFLPELNRLAKLHRVGLTLNYTATWEDLAQPETIRETIEPYRRYFANVYVMPVREAGKTPLSLLKNSVALNRELSWVKNALPDYPEAEKVEWYQENCDPKLKIKVDAEGGLVYPCENHAFTAGSLETHTIRQLWTRQLTRYPNESCLGCGKQRFRSYAMKHPSQVVALTRSVARSGKASIAKAAILLALALAPAAGSAQEAASARLTIGGGAGVASVMKGEASRVGPHLHGRAGLRVGHDKSVVLEMSAFGFGDESPDTSDLGVDGNGFVTVEHNPRIFRTSALLVGFQIGDPEVFYVRPALGLGAHHFAVYYPGPGTPTAERSAEGGPAAALSVGRVFGVGRAFAVAVEGVGLLSAGEDSSGGRKVVGLQVAPLLRF